MTKTVFAHTPPGSNFPPFVNLTRNDGGGYTLTVRSQGNGGSDIGAIVLSPENVEALATDALADLHCEPVASITLPVVDPGPDSLEREIQAKADNGPRVTPAALKDEIASTHYFTAADGVAGAKFNAVPRLTVGIDTSPSPLHLLTFCVLVLRNGFTVIGHSACASPENYNKEIGERIARENAERQIWPLLGFRLRDELARPVLTDADAAADLAGTPRPDNPTAEAADFLASVKACDLSGDAPCEACQ